MDIQTLGIGPRRVEAEKRVSRGAGGAGCQDLSSGYAALPTNLDVKRQN